MKNRKKSFDISAYARAIRCENYKMHASCLAHPQNWLSRYTEQRTEEEGGDESDVNAFLQGTVYVVKLSRMEHCCK